MYNGKGILFKKVAPRIFKFKNPLARMLTLALKDIGEGSLTEEQKETVRKLVIKEPRENFAQDYPLMPEWIRSFIERMYEEYSVTIA